MKRALRQALEPVLRDLRATGAPALEVLDEEWEQGPPRFASAWLVGESGSFGVSVRVFARKRDRIAKVAEQVQQWVIEDLWPAAAPIWPPCPNHPDTHPLWVSMIRGIATWTCPRDGTAIAPVGSLT